MPNRILKICPRGFSNETTYISVSEEEFAEADAYLDTLVDNPNDTSWWLDPDTKLIGGATVEYTWPQYKAEWIIPYKDWHR